MTTESEPLAINPDLIKQYAAGATDFGITNLITLFDFQRRQMQRAEDLSRAYLAQMLVLQSRLDTSRQGQPEPKTVSSRAEPKIPVSKVHTPNTGIKPPKPNLAIDIEL